MSKLCISKIFTMSSRNCCGELYIREGEQGISTTDRNRRDSSALHILLGP